MFVGAALLLTALPAVAEAADPDCAKANTQAALNMCAIKELDTADKELDHVRKDLSKKIGDPATQAALDEAEMAWDVYRDAECKFESSGVAGAAAEQMVLVYCEMERARTRIKLLRRILDCKKDDFTCPKLTR